MADFYANWPQGKRPFRVVESERHDFRCVDADNRVMRIRMTRDLAEKWCNRWNTVSDGAWAAFECSTPPLLRFKGKA